MFISAAQDQDSLSRTGEIRSAEVIIEKEKKLALPEANRLFQSAEVREISEEPPVIQFNIRAPQVRLPQFVPKFQIKSLEKGEPVKTFNTEARLAFGNYLSPLASLVHQNKKGNMSYGAQFFHESFLEGPVRNDDSGSSITRANVQSEWQLNTSSINLGIQYNRNGFFYYGMSDEAFVSSDERFLTNRIHTQDFQLVGGLSGRAINEKLSYYIDPGFSWVTAGENGRPAFAKELNFDLASGFDYKVDPSNQVGFDFSGLFSDYESGASLSRSVLSFEPWYKTQVKVIDFKVGLQANAINDTTSTTQVGAVMSLGIPLANSWKIEGGIDNRVQFNRLLDLYPSNIFLDDSLELQTSVVKVPFYGKVMGNILPNLEVQAGVEIQDIEKAHYFKPSPIDSSRFTLAYDTAELNVFKYHIELAYLLDPSLEVKAGFHFYDFSPGSEVQAWYRPSSIFNLEARKLWGKWLLTGRLKVVNGIFAPDPVSFEPIELEGFSDLSVKIDYRLAERAAIFAQGENLFNRSYEYYLNYPSRKMAIKLGFRYRF